MSMADTVQRYFDAWNAHDAEAIVATFAEGGTYEDPTTAGPLAGDAIGTNAATLWAAFPDVSFEITSDVQAGADLFAAQWTMRGTNSGSFAGLPPTGRSIAVKGADFIRVGNDGIRSVEGYFSPGEVPAQIGMQVIVQSDQVGPFTFGSSVRVASDVVGQPGAFSITSLHPRSPDERERVGEISREVAAQMRELEGFMGTGLPQGGHARLLRHGAREGRLGQRVDARPHRAGVGSLRRVRGDGRHGSGGRRVRVRRSAAGCPSPLVRSR